MCVGWSWALQTLWAPSLPLVSYPVLPVPQRLQYARADDEAALRWAWWRTEQAPADHRDNDDATATADDDAARGTLVGKTRMYSALLHPPSWFHLPCV
jgi:hypothetical protein